jgi:hypothetical protein
MTDSPDHTLLRQFVKLHHVHCSVEPEWVVVGGSRFPVGFDLRLFAVHDKDARALPGGPESRALAASLRKLAESLVPECRTAARFDIEPFSPVLYDSREVAGADEVALTIRLLHHAERYTDPVDASEERCLKMIRERLKLLALPER